MKTYLTLAAALAAFAFPSAASARDNAQGHWAWQTQPSPGPRSNLPLQVRVWVKDERPEIAGCNCDMTKANAADCMMTMPGKSAAPSNG